MSTSRLTIEPLRRFPAPVEIVSLGRLRLGRNVSPEFEIEVILGDGSIGFSGEPSLHSTFVNCAQIDLLEIGSFWRQGRRQGSRPAPTRLRANASLARDDVITGLHHPGGAVWPDPADPSAHPITGYLLSIKYCVGNAKVRFAWLPTAELFRSIFGVSSEFLIEVLLGSIDQFRPKRRMIDTRRSRFDASTKTCEIYASRQLLAQEAFVWAVCISDAKFAAAAKAPAFRLARASPAERAAGVPFEMPWPFSGPVDLEVEGRWATIQGGSKRFVVTRILSIAYQPKFDKIVVYAPGTPPSEVSAARVGPLHFVARSNADLILETGSIPGSRASVRTVQTSSSIFESISSVPIFTQVDGTFFGLQTPVYVPVECDPIEGATADANASGDNSLARVVLKRRQPQGGSSLASSTGVKGRERQHALKTTRSAIEAASQAMGYTLREVPEIEGILACVLVNSVSGQKILIADAGSTPKNPKSLGALASNTNRVLTSEQIEQALRTLVRLEGRWRSNKADFRGLRVEAINRSAFCWEDPPYYAKRVEGLIARFTVPGVNA